MSRIQKNGGGGGGGSIGGTTGVVDNALQRADGTGGATLQGSPVTLDDTGLFAGTSGPTAPKVADPANPTEIANLQTATALAAAALAAANAHSDAADVATLAAAKAYTDTLAGIQIARSFTRGHTAALSTILASPIAVPDNSIIDIEGIVTARNTGTGLFHRKTSVQFARMNGGAVTQQTPAGGLSDDGPVQVNPAGMTGIAWIGGATTLDLQFGGLAGEDTAGTALLAYTITATPAAT